MSDTIENIIEISYPGNNRTRETEPGVESYYDEWSCLVMLIERLIVENYQDGMSIESEMEWMKNLILKEVEEFEAVHDSTKAFVVNGLEQSTD